MTTLNIFPLQPLKTISCSFHSSTPIFIKNNHFEQLKSTSIRDDLMTIISYMDNSVLDRKKFQYVDIKYHIFETRSIPCHSFMAFR